MCSTPLEIMRKISVERLDRNSLRTFLGGAQALALALCAVISVAVAPPDAHSEHHRTHCGAQGEVSFLLDADWEQVDVQHREVVCAFRNKNGGFPTLTVTWEGLVSGSTSASVTARAESIIQSYQRVGLTDAQVIESHTLAHQTHARAFQTLVSYTTRATPMMALIVVLDGASRTFTLTILDTADRFKSSRPRLEAVASSLRVSGEASPVQVTLQEPLSVWGWGGLVLAGVVVILLGSGLLVRALRR